jgi:hypothetical protein
MQRPAAAAILVLDPERPLQRPPQSSAARFEAREELAMCSQSADGQQDPSEDSGSLLLRLRIEPGEPMSGAIAIEDHDGEVDFCGWMNLMVLITAARDRVGSEAGDGAQPPLVDPLEPQRNAQPGAETC